MAHSTVERIVMNPEFPDNRKIQKVVSVLNRGGVIAYPTDTNYGLGCSIFDKRAIDRVYRLKRLKKDKNLTIVCPDLSDIARYAQVENEAYRLMRRLVPGAYTFILKATPEVPKVFQSKKKTVGIRVPDHPVTLALARAFLNPIVSTTASYEGETLIDATDININLGHDLDMIIDCGVLNNDDSTVLDLSGPYPEVLRQGKGSTDFLLN